MLRAETPSDVKHSSSTQLLLHGQNGQNGPFALERWLHESPRSEPWNALNNEKTIKPDELRVLAQGVYAALGAK
jgi:hypothetical protein